MTMSEEIKVEIEVLPMEWKCVRCRQHKSECPNNYGLCFRCQDYMHHKMNDRCVNCGNDDATDNLCDGCRNQRIVDYDNVLIERIKKEKEASNP